MIEIRDLTKTHADKTAVDHLTVTVRPGVVTGFLGPNGAGKSTTGQSPSMVRGRRARPSTGKFAGVPVNRPASSVGPSQT